MPSEHAFLGEIVHVATGGALVVFVHAARTIAAIPKGHTVLVYIRYSSAFSGVLEVCCTFETKACASVTLPVPVPQTCIAAQNGQPAMAKYLATAGVDVNAAAKDGSTPLYVAAQNGRLEW